MSLTYGSVCSGIEAATAAWHPLGWRPAFFSEIEAFPRAVLQHHYPETPLHGDFTTIQAGDYDPIDLLVGGTPCQSFSVAGLRGGLDDDRGNLALEYLRLADRLRPRWLVWENVPGVLSSNGGRDFGSILGGVGELGYGFAYRVLDAQFFGLAQRRKRVFVVGYLGDWRRAAAVLFERDGLSGNPAPSREAREGPAQPVAECLRAGGKDYKAREVEVAQPVMAAGPAGGNQGGDYIVHAIQAGALRENPDSGPDGIGVQADHAYTLEARAEVQAVAFALRGREGGAMAEVGGEVSNALRTPGGGASIPMVASFGENVRGEVRLNGGDGAITDALSRGGGKPGQGYAAAMVGSAVRRLTPRECERLMGFPDDFTLIPVRGKPAADGPRYKALGNSMAVPVMGWLGRRIQQVEAICSSAKAAS